jgi:GrpB-like predicted nucleotidyltransferase (UPF0157 family)
MPSATTPSEDKGIPARTWRLSERLTAAGIDTGAPPLEAWRRLHDVEGPRATLIDLYALVAGERGLLPTELTAEERLALWKSVNADIWPGFETTGNSERGGDPIAVVDYDPAWPAAFESWRQRIAAVLGVVALRIEHVGSTAVPGLPAKPHLDIQVIVADIGQESSYVPPLTTLDLQLRSRDDLHRYFRPVVGRPRDVHVHVCPLRSEWERDHLLFRDYLRAHPDARDAYAATKRAAALTWFDDRVGYTDAKSEIILDILDAARQWVATP